MSATKSLLWSGSLRPCSLAGNGGSQAADLAGAKTSIARGLDTQYSHIEALYKDIHSHPELGFQEARMAAKLAGEMRALGYAVTEGVGKTGLVAIYKNGAGPTVMVRTELDALPLPEKTGLPYASTAKQTLRGVETPVAHACGHDIHMSVWVAVAKTLIDLKDQWSGTLMFVAQPAEEGGGGAKAMLADGLFTRFPKPDMGFALHVGPGPYGYVSYKPGVINSTSDGLSVLFIGKGGHGSRPHVTIDPVMMAGHFIVDVQSVISRAEGRREVRRRHHRLGAGRQRRQRDPRHRPAARHHPLLRRRHARQDDRGRRAHRQGRRHDGGRAAAGGQDHRGRQGRDQRCRAGGARRRGAEGGVRRQGVCCLPAPGSASEDYSEFIIAGVPSFYFGIGGLDPKAVAQAAATNTPLPGNHSPEFAPVPEPTIRTGTLGDEPGSARRAAEEVETGACANREVFNKGTSPPIGRGTKLFWIAVIRPTSASSADSEDVMISTEFATASFSPNK